MAKIIYSPSSTPTPLPTTENQAERMSDRYIDALYQVGVTLATMRADLKRLNENLEELLVLVKSEGK